MEIIKAKQSSFVPTDLTLSKNKKIMSQNFGQLAFLNLLFSSVLRKKK